MAARRNKYRVRSTASVARETAAVYTISRAPESEYWQDQIRQFGRRLLFVDTGAILGCMDPKNSSFNSYFDELVGETLITSTYVVAETVRRIVKAEKPDHFKGPLGQRGSDLALHVLRGWLVERKVSVLTVPDAIFEAAKDSWEKNRAIGCDLTDILSYEIVRGLEQSRIVSPDGHFRSLGLTCYPSAL